MSTVKTNRSRSLNFEDHKGLMHKLAKKYYARLLSAQIMGVDFDDVMGELSVSFVRAVKGYNPDAGWTFTAYLGMCAQNNFNKYARRLMLEQYGSESAADFDAGVVSKRGLGYVSFHDLRSGDGESEVDFLDLIPCNAIPSPEALLDAAMTLNSIVKDETLSAETRVYISMIATGSTDFSEQVKKGIRSKSNVIRREISARYGVEMGNLSV